MYLLFALAAIGLLVAAAFFVGVFGTHGLIGSSLSNNQFQQLYRSQSDNVGETVLISLIYPESKMFSSRSLV